MPNVVEGCLLQNPSIQLVLALSSNIAFLSVGRPDGTKAKRKSWPGLPVELKREKKKENGPAGLPLQKWDKKVEGLSYLS